ncbi:MAG TPA: ROK family protein [Acidimicrobiales bacterium]|jgi:polyphosphate glucokinase|nr:ROK family protein [Acidimicrobiales bacterium]
MAADRSAPGTTRKQPARATTAKKKAPARAGSAKKAATLAIDVGGTGLKASVLDPAGAMEVDRVRVSTSYPCPPTGLVETLRQLVQPLPVYNRVSVGFPGMVRDGRVLSAPHFVTESGPGSKTVPELVTAWSGFDLAAALEAALDKPTKVVNDADLQGAAVVKGKGLELVVTLGTGVGTGLFFHGRLTPHMELAHHPLHNNESYNDYIGNAARKRIGDKKWNKRVKLAVETLDALFFYDQVYLGGGNSKRVTADLGPKATIVDNEAGILGGIKLWERQ